MKVWKENGRMEKKNKKKRMNYYTNLELINTISTISMAKGSG